MLRKEIRKTKRIKPEQDKLLNRREAQANILLSKIKNANLTEVIHAKNLIEIATYYKNHSGSFSFHWVNTLFKAAHRLLRVAVLISFRSIEDKNDN